MNAPDEKWLAFGKMLFGYLLLVLLCIMAGIIALGKVEMQTSAGLDILLGCITTLAGGFVNWAFGSKNGGIQ